MGDEQGSIERCSFNVVHKDVVELVKKKMPGMSIFLIWQSLRFSVIQPE